MLLFYGSATNKYYTYRHTLSLHDAFPICLNRPEVHNAVSDELGHAFGAALIEARGRQDAKVVVLRGEGRSFCSGRDFREMGERPEGVGHYEYMTAGQQRIKMMVDMGKPMIAALKGAVLGAGCERSEEHTSELQSLMRISYAVFCLKKKKQYQNKENTR